MLRYSVAAHSTGRFAGQTGKGLYREYGPVHCLRRRTLYSVAIENSHGHVRAASFRAVLSGIRDCPLALLAHYPYDGIFFVAHCQAPRRMNGRDYEPPTIMTHYESDYGTACKTHYLKGQEVTVLIPNLRCTQWQGFRGKIVGSPSYPACRSQMEIAIDGDWQRLLREMQGFHTQIVYGDYTREVGYALKKLGGQITWRNYSHGLG